MRIGMTALALLVLVGAPLMAAVKVDDPTATGKITAFEAGKTISIEVENEKKEFKITEETKIEGDMAVGKVVQVWAKDGAAVKIVVKE